MPLAVFDIDGTLTPLHIWKGLMTISRRAGSKNRVHHLYMATHLPLYLARRLHLLSEQGFRHRWAADLGWYLRGQTPAQVHAWGDWIASQYLANSWRTEVRARLDAHLQRGDTVILLSAAPQPIVERIARYLGAQHGLGTRFQLVDNRYSGRVQPPICLGEGKAQRLGACLQARQLPSLAQAGWAYADSITDLPILAQAAHPVAVFPDDRLQVVARSRGWETITA